MPSIVKTLLVVAGIEGLILHPLGQRDQQTIQIKYKTCEISSYESSSIPSSFPSAEAHGIVGLLNVATVSYLIAITVREHVAQIRGVPVYVITDVALIPLSSQSEVGVPQINIPPSYDPQSLERLPKMIFVARKVIGQVQDSLKDTGKATIGAEDSETSDERESFSPAEIKAAEDDHISLISSGSKVLATRPDGDKGTVYDVVIKRGSYGRFAERWFSKNGWSTDQRRAQGMSTDVAQRLRSTNDRVQSLQDFQLESRETKQLEHDLRPQDGATGAVNALLPKLLRTTQMLLTSRSFFYSYDLDITRRLGQEKTYPEIPLHKLVDELFFWNSHLTVPFIQGRHHEFVLPLMQGFVGQRVFSVNTGVEKPPSSVLDTTQGVGRVDVQTQANVGRSSSASKDFLLTLISRRSVKRPGLRYLRRGIDDEGETANTVETEQILSRASWASNQKIYSFTQIRGSIPLFFSQSPYSFKPVPVLQHSPDTNQRAFDLHFSNIISRYGGVEIVLLVDRKGGEAEIGRRYDETTTQYNSKVGDQKLGFEWFDFHAVCRGMRYENVSLLMDSVGSKLDEFGETVEFEGRISPRQSGVLRTNCMDCLDRTNVVQSACGQRVLEKQLREEGFKVDLLTDSSTQWFNSLYADNGDQISREYSSTAALKGDYTRTRRRNYRGAINDLGLTLSRYYNNIINDYFSQAVIDYLLGNVTAQIFDEFEATLGNKDPAISMDRLRAGAIETSSKIVIEDQKEDLMGGYCLMRPRDQNTLRTLPFEECVLLVTDAALYRVKFDWNVEKVFSFERVDLRSVASIVKGTYITSTLAATEKDVERNVGFVIKYRPGKEDVARVNTRSLSSAVGQDDGENCGVESASSRSPSGMEDIGALKVLAFKALPARDSFTSVKGHQEPAMSEKELVSNVCETITRVAHGGIADTTGFVEDKDIISLEEARKSTGLIEQWSHSLKKMVWA